MELAQVSKTEKRESGAFLNKSNVDFIIFFFDMQGIVHYEHVPERQTVD